MLNQDLSSGIFLGDFYGPLVTYVTTHGQRVVPRGKANKEVRPVVMATHAWGALKKAGVNYRFACAEAMSYVCGWNDVAWQTQFNLTVARFSDDGRTFHGHYGRRLFNQLPRLIETLRLDPDSRQAVANIWLTPDSATQSKDLPCNTQLLLKVRNGKLDLMVMRRSSDLIWGVPYDHHCFWALLTTLANCLKCVEPGALYEVIDSLHVYEESAGFYTDARVLKSSMAEHTKSPHPWPKLSSLEEYRWFFGLIRAQVEGKEAVSNGLAEWLLGIKEVEGHAV